jgi:hypothetical protein
MENALRYELEALIKDYDVIKDYLSGAELSIDNLREQLQSFKDRLSKVRLYLMIHTEKKGNMLNLPFDPIMNAIDVALILMEGDPSNARQYFQASLSVSSVKIEDLMAFLSLIRDGI